MGRRDQGKTSTSTTTWCLELRFPSCRTFLIPLLICMRFLSNPFSSQSKSLWMAAWPSGVSAPPQRLVSLTILLTPLLSLLMKWMMDTHWPWGYSSSYWLPIRLCTTDHHPLGVILILVITVDTLCKSLATLLGRKDRIGDSIYFIMNWWQNPCTTLNSRLNAVFTLQIRNPEVLPNLTPEFLLNQHLNKRDLENSDPITYSRCTDLI